MSELRKQLDDAKRDYLSARYPGDLAANLFLKIPYGTPITVVPMDSPPLATREPGGGRQLPPTHRHQYS